ncbi:hypothetical protein [Aminipila sp.]|uniref:hypothetical protein n=1 Tax=Aminipila sp. TaxID=2060095 RepID=UPI0028A211FC|nr:hypothetical protein [Aminipila sp.]
MFTRKKSLVKRKEFYIALVAILGIGYLMSSLLMSPGDEKENQNISANVKQTVEQKMNNKDIDDNEEDNDIVSENNTLNSDNNVQENQLGEYYLVKESDGIIKVYQYDKKGKEHLLRSTDILYSLLSEDDQELFSEGVEIKTEDELLELLQDFES